MIIYAAEKGERLDRAATNAIELASLSNKNVRFKFNGTSMVVTKDSRLNEVLYAYQTKSAQHRNNRRDR
jgi:hypothetical protein